MSDITWRPVIGSKYYEVSSCGLVRSLPRTIISSTGLRRKYSGQVLNPYLDRYGYRRVRISGKDVYVHHLVSAAFIGKRPKKYDINHINGIKLDNALVNLEYVTRTENIQHAYRLRLNGRVKLLPEQVLDIRRRLLSGELGAALAKEFGVTCEAISAIKLRKVWKHV